jgi:hypothetical protein
MFLCLVFGNFNLSFMVLNESSFMVLNESACGGQPRVFLGLGKSTVVFSMSVMSNTSPIDLTESFGTSFQISCGQPSQVIFTLANKVISSKVISKSFG